VQDGDDLDATVLRLVEQVRAVRGQAEENVRPAGALAARLRAAAAAGEAAVVTGNTGDVFVTSDLPDALRLPQLVASVHDAAGRAPVLYSPGAGACALTPPGGRPPAIRLPGRDMTPGDALPQLLDAVTCHTAPVAVIVDHADLLVPALPAGTTPSLAQAVVLETLQRAAIDPRFDAGGHALVLISRGGEVHRALLEASGFTTVRAPLPDREDLQLALDRIQERAAAQPDRYAPLTPGVTVEAAAAAGRGLRVDDYVRAAREAAASGRTVGLEDVGARKAAGIERVARGTLRQHPNGRTLADVAGLPHIRRYVDERLLSGAWPPGILLAGPPGVGKTFVVRAIAAALGRPAVAFHLVRSPWVGETEANTARALSIIDELAPLVVHIDEADRSLGGRRSDGPSGDSGTSERFQAALWEFTGEGASRPDVLFCLTTNRTDLLDEAQHSRVEIIPILHPTRSEISELLPALARQLGRELDPGIDLGEVARHPRLRMTTARHLLRILGRAATLADLAPGGQARISHGQLVAAIDDYLPQTDQTGEELMALTALARTSFRSLLPWAAAGEAPPYVEPLLAADGTLDEELLRARIEQLSSRAWVR
jgi:hypothetical protein